MAISFIDSSFEVSDTNGTSIIVAVPAHAVDDLILVWMVSDGASETLTISGTETWNYLSATQSGVGASMRLAWVLATGTSGFDATCTVGSSESQVAICSIFRGVDTSTTFGVNASNTGTDDVPTVTQTTGTTSDSWAFAMVGMDRNSLTRDGSPPSNTTLIFQKRDVGTASSQCGGGCAYDETGDVDSESYTWPAQDRSDGWRANILELLEGSAAPISKADSTASACGVSGAVDALFSQTTRAGTVAASSVGSINAMFGDTADTGTVAVASVGSLNDLFVLVTNQPGTADVAVVGVVDAISAVLLTTGTASAASIGSIQALDSFSTQAGTVDVSAIGSLNDLYGEMVGASSANVAAVGSVDTVAVLLSSAGTANAALVGSVSAIAAVLLTTGTVGAGALGSVQLLDAFTNLASDVDVSAIGSINDLYGEAFDTSGVSVTVTGSVSSLASLLVATGTVDASAIGAVINLLNRIEPINGTVAVTVNGGGEGVVPGGPPVAGPPTYKSFYGFGFGRGY